MIAVRYGFETLAVTRALVRLELILVNLIIMYVVVKVSPWKMFKNVFHSVFASLIMASVAMLLKDLSEKYDLYMLSNNNPICLPYSSKMFDDAGAPLAATFRKCFFSYELKTLKPSAEFYLAVMKEIGLAPEEMLFIDDSQKNVDGDLAVGLPAVYYEPGSDLDALIEKVLNGEKAVVC